MASSSAKPTSRQPTASAGSTVRAWGERQSIEVRPRAAASASTTGTTSAQVGPERGLWTSAGSHQPSAVVTTTSSTEPTPIGTTMPLTTVSRLSDRRS